MHIIYKIIYLTYVTIISKGGFNLNTYTASRMMGGSWTKVVYPDTLIVGDNTVKIIKKQKLGMTNYEEELNYSKIASVRVFNGIFFSDLTIETHGGSVNDFTIKYLPKKSAKEAEKHIKEKIND